MLFHPSVHVWLPPYKSGSDLEESNDKDIYIAFFDDHLQTIHRGNYGKMTW
jgi:hypothetical protein